MSRRLLRNPALLLLITALATAPTEAQVSYATPEAGWSSRRSVVLGGRVGREVFGGFDLVLNGLVSFPDASRTVDRPASARRSSWQTSLSVAYVFDRSRAFAPYAGAGGRWRRATLSIDADGFRSTAVQSGFGFDLFGGVRFPRLPAEPWLEYRSGGESWTLTGGIQWRFGERRSGEGRN